jgi:uncharacterized protein (TIGR02271 family)
MISTEQIEMLQAASVVGSDGERIGRVGQVLVDTVTGQPEWVSVRTGLFGSAETLVPISEATVQSDELTVPFTKDQIKSAPRITADQELSQDDEAQLYSHYGLPYGTDASPSGLPTGGMGGGMAGGTGGMGTEEESATTGGMASDEEFATTGRMESDDEFAAGRTDDAMTRSEENLRVGTERVETGRARLRKYVETEDVNVPVTVTKEKVRLETEPITDANRERAYDGPEIAEGEHEVTVAEERPIVSKETVPVERVRLAKDTVDEEQTVSESVRKERIDAEGVDPYPAEPNATESERNVRP